MIQERAHTYSKDLQVLNHVKREKQQTPVTQSAITINSQISDLMRSRQLLMQNSVGGNNSNKNKQSQEQQHKLQEKLRYNKSSEKKGNLQRKRSNEKTQQPMFSVKTKDFAQKQSPKIQKE